MKLYFDGHDCRYAAEQTLLTLFPTERPEYPAGPPAGDCCVLTLRRGDKYTTCTCRLTLGGAAYSGRATAKNADMTDELRESSLHNRVVKLAFYRAALRSGVPVPPWGSLTGVRPGKLMSALLRQGLTPAHALRSFREEYDVSRERGALCLATALATETARASLESRDICLYVGIPFCPTRCAYCSFVSASVEKSMALIEPYLSALSEEIDATARAVKAAGGRVVSLYMGGGTPTTLTAAQLDALLNKLETAFDLTATRELTVEAGRPDTITAEKLRVLRAHRVDRVSVNPQTMTDSVLTAIGRRHTAEDILSALRLVRETGGFQVNMDLIAGLTTDTPEGFAHTMDQVLALAPENITVHTLSLKRGATLTAEGGRPDGLPGDEDVRRMLDESRPRLEAAGYAPYYLYRQKFMSGGGENVGWTKPGRENLYNICIMEELCSIVSVGAGGSTKLTGGEGRIVRLTAPKYPQEYIGEIRRTCADKQRIEEFYHGI